jgi:aspartate ammonia-lyase
MRIEHDFLGALDIPKDALYGIHAARAKRNFPLSNTFPTEWYQNMGIVKQACYETIAALKIAISQKYPEKLNCLKLPEDAVLNALLKASIEITQGQHFNNFIVPATQGGAGTSINMNVNEILANRALLIQGFKPGAYEKTDPIEHANLYQSTNDVVPTALRVTLLQLLDKLELAINQTRQPLEKLENKYRNSLRTGFTQMQQAVPSSFGQLFGAYNDALSRDWWRVSKSFERLKTVNLGGGATGTGLSIPRFFIMEVVPTLKKLTGLPITQSENLTETTSNLDTLVEVHAILKAHAVNLEKMGSDLRLLSSDLMLRHEVQLPAKQTGSSIMPGKVNPVIVEYLISAAHKIYSNDMLITQLAAMGNLELNAYLPEIGCAFIESIKLLIACNQTLASNLLNELIVNEPIAKENLFSSPSVCTALIPVIGYHKASLLAKIMQANQCSIFEANKIAQVIASEKLEQLMMPGSLLQKGFSVNDL